MRFFDPVVSHELPVIRKIIEDETWLEGERRGCRVTPDDHVVRDRVCAVILRIGQQLREAVSGTAYPAPAEPPAGMTRT
jgi:hypothetical protein